MRGFLRYGVAVFLVALIVAIKVLIGSTEAPFLLLFVAVFASTQLGGARAGAVAAVLAAPTANWFFYPPAHALSTSPRALLDTGIFLVEAGLIIFATDRARRLRRTAEGARREAEAERHRLERLVADAPIPIAVLRGPDLRVALANAAARGAMAGRPLDGRPLRELVAELTPSDLVDAAEAVFRSGRPFSAREMFVGLSALGARDAWFDVSIVPLRPVAEAGGVDEMVVVAADVSEQVLARRRLDDLFVRAPAAIAVQRGPDHVYELANPAYVRLLGGRELVGHPVADVLPPQASLRRILDEVYASGETMEGRERPFRIDRSGDGRFDEQALFDFICQPIRDGGGRTVGVLTFGVDVTEPVEARRRIETLARDLADAVRARDEFLSIASHELRTPLTSLSLQIEMLHRALGKSEPPTLEQIGTRVHTIEALARRQARLVEDLLDVTRIAAGRLRIAPEPLDLAEMALELAARFAEDLRTAGCELRLVGGEQPVPGRWDRMRLEQVLDNLVSNALKFGRGRPVEVAVSVVEPDRVRITVSDEGIGVPPEDQARIFERFARAVPERHYGGFGLGLWITRNIVEAHGGTITVASEPGRGARFTVELPRETVPRIG